MPFYFYSNSHYALSIATSILVHGILIGAYLNLHFDALYARVEQQIIEISLEPSIDEDVNYNMPNFLSSELLQSPPSMEFFLSDTKNVVSPERNLHNNYSQKNNNTQNNANIKTRAKTAARTEILQSAIVIDNTPPVYPYSARSTSVEGKVILTVNIASNGALTGVEVFKSSGFSMLDSAAIEAVRKWRFIPARMGSFQIDSTLQIPVRFSLH